jgi:hypothetical protein
MLDRCANFCHLCLWCGSSRLDLHALILEYRFSRLIPRCEEFLLSIFGLGMLLRGSVFPAHRYLNVCVCGLARDSDTLSLGFDQCVPEFLCLRRGSR